MRTPEDAIVFRYFPIENPHQDYLDCYNSRNIKDITVLWMMNEIVVQLFRANRCGIKPIMWRPPVDITAEHEVLLKEYLEDIYYEVTELSRDEFNRRVWAVCLAGVY